MGVVLKNDNQEIELAIKGYESAMPAKSYWDNNWLVLSCRLTEGGISMYGEFPCFMTMELQHLEMLLERFRSGTSPSVSWNGTEPNFSVCLSQNHFLTIFFYAEAEGWEVTFHKNATARDVEALIEFCSDSLGLYPVRNVGTK